jgi:D-alanyl-D-alanine carboxypeptidase/D-alanyl-D-alanine-endopeptidase (penicillin-binding protein 4)
LKYGRELGAAAIGAFSGGTLLVAMVLLLNPILDSASVAAPSTSPSPTVSSSPSPTPSQESPSPTESPSESAAAQRSCSIADLLSSAYIVDWQGEVRLLETNEVLYSVSAEQPNRPASVLKLLTAAAALEVLGPDYRVETKIYRDTRSRNRIYFVGSGDVTLTSLSSGSSVYSRAARVSDLAQQTLAALGGRDIREIVLDSSLYSGQNGEGEWHETWDRRGLTEGYMAPVSALQIDGGRIDPKRKLSPRTETPVLAAGEALKVALGSAGRNAELKLGTLPSNAEEIATVTSAPLSTWIDYMLLESDNALAEAIGRLVSYEVGLDGSMSSLTEALTRALANSNLDLGELFVQDASGLSRNSMLAPRVVNDLLALVEKGYGDFELIDDGLSLAAQTGSLSARFSGSQADSAGQIQAKTGWIRTGYSLAGFIDAADGSRLSFAVYNLASSVNLNHRQAMDDVVYGIYKCGSDLADD